MSNPSPAPVPAEEPEERIPLEEFCAETSASDRRVELLACFWAREKGANRNHDTRAAYAKRYALTESQPTK